MVRQSTHSTSHSNTHSSAHRRARGTIFGSTTPCGRVCALRQLTATLTATLTARLTATLTDPAHSPVNGRARSERRGSGSGCQRGPRKGCTPSGIIVPWSRLACYGRKPIMIRGGDMARNYDGASATRRERLPVEARSDGAVFGPSSPGGPASTRATSAGSSVARSSRTRRRSFVSPTPSERSGGWSTRRRPESSSKLGVERRKVLVSYYAPRTRRDRECRNARTSAPGAAAGLAPCASGVVPGRPLL
jgi:hypothetical protein